jgi:hypothetical protein
MRGIALALTVLLTACGSLPAPAPAPSIAPTFGLTSTATPLPSPSASPSPAALSSADGSITVTKPLANAPLASPAEIAGTASVFEAALQWRIVDSAGRVIVEGIATASAGAPARGDFSVTATFTTPPGVVYATVEDYSRSPKDGSIDEIVRVPVTLATP